jgi:hypothetical protein
MFEPLEGVEYVPGPRGGGARECTGGPRLYPLEPPFPAALTLIAELALRAWISGRVSAEVAKRVGLTTSAL